MATHLKQHAVTDTGDHSVGTLTAGQALANVGGTLTGKTFGTSATASALVERGGSGQITLPVADPSIATDAASKGYVDKKVVEGVTWKELVLVADQMVNGGSGVGGVAQATLIDFTSVGGNNFVTATDTFKISDGTTTETWTFMTTRTGAFEVTIGGSAAASLANLVTAINLDSTLWSAVDTAGLDDYFSTLELNQAVIYRTVPLEAPDRVYGDLTTQTDINVIAFAAGDQDYRIVSGTESNLPTTAGEPGAKRFGFGRPFTSLQQQETHRISEDSTAFSWDSDDDVWQQTASVAVTAGNGIDVSGSVVSTKPATADAVRQYGALVNTSQVDGSGLSGTYGAVATDNSTLEVSASNQIRIKAGSNLAKFWGFGAWSSSGGAADREPTVTELNTFFGTGATNVGYFGFMVESGGGFSTSTFMAYKKGTDTYHLVEMS